MTGSLAGRRILVTGAASGIGRACVELFVAEGATIGGLDRDAGGLDSLPEQFGADRVSTFAADVARSAEVTRAVDDFAKRAKGLDGLVNAAGVDLVSPIGEMTDDAWGRIMTINLDGPMHVCRAALPHMRASGGGAIVNVSSGAGLKPFVHRTAYSASKAGLQMFSKALAMEAAEVGIRVNCVCPGAVDTELLRSHLAAAPDPAAERERVKAQYALRRIAEPREIAAAILWLIGPGSSYVTGTAVAVDGGRTFH